MTLARMAPSPSPGKTYYRRNVSCEGRKEGRKTNHVVPLPRLEHLAAIHDGIERAPTGIQDLAPRPLYRLLKRALRLGNRVAQRKHDRQLIELAHELQDLLRERPADGREAEKSGRADVLDDREESAESGSVRFGAGEVPLVFRKRVAAVIGDQALRRSLECAQGRKERERTLESTSQNMFFATSSGIPWRTKYRQIVSATPTPEEPAPKKRMRWSLRGIPVIWNARIAPERTTAPVPWICRVRGQRGSGGRTEAGTNVVVEAAVS